MGFLKTSTISGFCKFPYIDLGFFGLFKDLKKKSVISQ
jgi:hypothetical protein